MPFMLALRDALGAPKSRRARTVLAATTLALPRQEMWRVYIAGAARLGPHSQP